MPKLPKHIEKVCANCQHYETTVNGPVCHFWEKVFPEHDAWAYNPDKIQPGKRTCKHWSC